MNIVHFSIVHTYQDPRILYKECTSLSNAGFTVDLYARSEQERVINNVSIHPVPTSKSRIIRALIKTWVLFFKLKKKNADIYHFHDPELIPVGLMLRLCGKRVIYDVHEHVPDQILSKQWIPKPLRFFVSKCVDFIERKSARFFTGIVVATPTIENRFSKFNENILLLNNYPILEKFNVLDRNVKQTSNAKNICYIGSITQIRGIYQIVQALGHVNVQLLLAGKFDSEKLKQDCEQLPGWSKVLELGYLSYNELFDVMKNSMAGLVLLHPVPNFLNAQSTKIYEYMAAGLPVIASDFPLWKNFVEGDQVGLCVDPFDIKKITEAIEYLCNHPAEAKQMGENGRKLIETQYNWGIEAKKLISFYRGFLSVNDISSTN